MSELSYWTRISTGQLSRRHVLRSAALGGAGLAAAALIGCSSGKEQKPAEKTGATAPGATATATASATGTASAAAALPANLILLKTSPERGPGGTKFTITGEGLKPSTRLDFVWNATNGVYKTELNNNRMEFFERLFTLERTPLGQVTTDAQGKVSASFTAPVDFGGVHDIYALIDGKESAKAGFLIEKTVNFSPSEGPLGTPITVRITGLGSSAFTSTGAIRYDNKYTGFVTATTTRGTAEFQLRAAGPVGDHLIELYGASHATPYLNVEQSPVAAVGTYRATFRVTRDGGPPANVLEWPEQSLVSTSAVMPRTTIGLAGTTPTPATLSPATGPIRSTPKLEASGLPAGAAVDLVWMTVTGNDVTGWQLGEEALGKATAAAGGTLSVPVTVPESLGGWHGVRIVSGGKVLAEAPYFVERNLERAPAQRVKAGEKFTVQLKGVGWTELDNGAAVTYDNSYLGYACGFSSKGDVTVELVATGGPGTHLIDFYPMIYDGGHGKWPWQYNLPMLTFTRDHPSLGLGYRLPAFHLAIEVV